MLIIAEQVEQKFQQELQELLNRYKAEMLVEDHWVSYPDTGRDLGITVTIPAVYDNNDNLIQEFTSFNLGGYLAYKE